MGKINLNKFCIVVIPVTGIVHQVRNKEEDM